MWAITCTITRSRQRGPVFTFSLLQLETFEMFIYIHGLQTRFIEFIEQISWNFPWKLSWTSHQISIKKRFLGILFHSNFSIDFRWIGQEGRGIVLGQTSLVRSLVLGFLSSNHSTLAGQNKVPKRTLSMYTGGSWVDTSVFTFWPGF
jgi:hypothetical protein